MSDYISHDHEHDGIPPRVAYFAVTLLALMVITLTGHLGGILSGVETP